MPHTYWTPYVNELLEWGRLQSPALAGLAACLEAAERDGWGLQHVVPGYAVRQDAPAPDYDLPPQLVFRRPAEDD